MNYQGSEYELAKRTVVRQKPAPRPRPTLTDDEKRVSQQLADEIRKLGLVNHKDLGEEITYTADVIARKMHKHGMRLNVCHCTLTFDDDAHWNETEGFERVELLRPRQQHDLMPDFKGHYVPVRFWQWRTHVTYRTGSGGQGINYELVCEFCEELRSYIAQLTGVPHGVIIQ